MTILSIAVLVLFYFPVSALTFFYVTKIVNREIRVVIIRKIILGIVVLALILIPTWDVLIGRLYLTRLCFNDGGVKVYEESSEGGIYIAKDYKTPLIDSLLNKGFKYVEINEKSGGYERLYIEEGEIISSSVKSILSKYEYRANLNYEVGVWFGVEAYLKHYYIQKIDDKRIVAERKDYYVYNGWLESFLASPFGISISSCYESFSHKRRFSSDNSLFDGFYGYEGKGI
ncbi:hypothetical protein MIB92_17815 [Aestuariirhabdus sp. Z084]|uniref:hypothetical protein n=1 Tax=Aestuariirhabdus haliotis TaxID=2918751 RepID=UPI00201B3A5F|nr:hypothetical protein [Aestuariirhabdus haliotis]MCL6417523.1 hypothetical protein [Aestuariirhabdus haliotis]MCL6421465.1 hypothetical protein [Aestuariirhabdus haliotis]